MRTTARIIAAGAGLLTAVHLAGAQPLQPQVLFSFTNNGPANPYGRLIQASDGNFYGTTVNGGNAGVGTVFRMTPNGEWTSLASFGSTNGAYPYAGLTLGNDGNFYGTTGAGDGGDGTVFRVTTNGVLTTLTSFFSGFGAYPCGEAALTLGSDGNFYGTSVSGGYNGEGYAFKVAANGVLTVLGYLDFYSGGLGGEIYPENPYGRLVQGSDGMLYGTTVGFWDAGTVFAMSPNGGFGFVVPCTNGSDPYAGLTPGRDGSFYGTTFYGGNFGYGTVFRVTTNGLLTTLVSFADTNGAYPYADLTLGSDGNLYGTTTAGGNSGNGTVFEVTTNGVLTTIASFAGTNGAAPYAALTMANDGNFYGATYGGGSAGNGTVFRVTTTGALTTLVSFPPVAPMGAGPTGLTQGSDGSLYGTTVAGGSSDDGTVFRLATNGVLSTLASFAGTNGATPFAGLTLGNDGNFYGTTLGGGAYTDAYGYGLGTVFRVLTNGVLTTLGSFGGTNGAAPFAGLTLGNDGNFYGATRSGGTSNSGTVFRLTTNAVLSTLYSFGSITGTNGNPLDGASPDGSLLQGSDGSFYGTTYWGGTNGGGTVFKLTTSGALTTLASFGHTGGEGPEAGLALGNDGSFYGTTAYGGSSGYGTVFRVTTNGVLTTLASFDGTNGSGPFASLTLGSDGNFYGTTMWGGDGFSGDIYSGYGTVFQVATNGTLTTLVSFGARNTVLSGRLMLGSDGNFYGTAGGGTGGGGVIYRLRRGASIQSFGMKTNGFQLNTLNVGGSGWVILESSSDLMHWTSIQTNGTAAAQRVIDPAALSQPRQFYRLRQL
jgi:uncharacterized repeat protein (TIGR03803 family)